MRQGPDGLDKQDGRKTCTGTDDNGEEHQGGRAMHVKPGQDTEHLSKRLPNF